MTAEVKLRTLAADNVTLQGYFGTNPFRWFDTQVPQYVPRTWPTAQYLRVSTIFEYSMTGLLNLTQVRFQLDVLHPDPEVARAAIAAIIAFLGTCDFAANYQFGSPVTTPPQFPVYILNQRGGLKPQLEPPVWAETLDFRFYNLEN